MFTIIYAENIADRKSSPSIPVVVLVTEQIEKWSENSIGTPMENKS